MKTQLIGLVTGLALAACGDDGTMNTPDAPPSPDAPLPDSPDPDAPPSWTKPAAQSLALSATGPDRMYSVAVDPATDKFYVAGYRAATPTGDRKIIVTRLLSTGLPDTTFGTGGTLDTEVVFKGGDDEIDVVKVDGGVLISATVAAAAINALDAADTDIGLIKVTDAGALDTNFGGGDGVAVFSLNSSALNTATPPAPFGRDQVRGLFVDGDGKIYIHAGARANGDVMGGNTPRTDTDYIVAKFLDDGSDFDTSFSTDGKYEQDIYIGGMHSNATPRGITVLADGSVLAGGYANVGLTTGPQIVMFRLTSAGALDTNFAPTSVIPGLYHATVLGTQTEMYNFAMHGDTFVTGGYGRDSGDINDWISLRYNAATAARDTTWGGAGFTDGKVLFDPTPSNSAGSNACRNAVALPGDKTLLVGMSNRDVNTSASPMPTYQDAAFAVLDANGALDTAYGSGVALYQFGNDGADMFWGAAVNSTHALIVGWRGATVSPQTDTDNDDAYAVLLPLE